MTIDQFLEELERVGKNKAILETYTNTDLGKTESLIRFRPRKSIFNLCPIEYVYARLKHKNMSQCSGLDVELGYRLGLSDDDASAIMKAADENNGYSSILRRDMMRALGL